MKALAGKNALRLWFTVPIHRHVEDGREGMPVPMMKVEDLFEVALLLATEKGETHIRALKSPVSPDHSPVFVLDPSSMLNKDAS